MPRLVKRVVIAACVTAVVAGCTNDASPPTEGAAGGSPPATSNLTPTPPPVDYTKWKAGRSTPVADPIYPKRGNPNLDVLHYGLELSWKPKAKTLTGTATLRIRPTKNVKKLRLDFMPYKLDGVTVDGLEATARVTKRKLTVPAKLTKNQPVTLEVRYHGKPRPVPMPSEREDVEALGLTITRDGGLWTMQEPFGAFTWYPANDQPSDEAMYDIAVTVPAGWKAIASGTPAGKRGSTFRYRSADPVASYLTTLAVGKYKKVTAKGPHDLPLTYWYRPGVDESRLPSMRKSPEFVTWLEQRFGRYPFASGGIVLVDSKSGMETQQMITFGSKGGTLSEEERILFERNLLHEYAHHWFGNSVSPTNWEDLWLNEGWATYVQFLYQQEQEQFSDADLEAFLRQSDAELRAELGPPGSPDASRFAEGNVYICPAAMLKELNDELGDDKFFALAKAWVQKNRNTQQDRASFIAFVNKNTGDDFTELINSWLDAETTPS